MFKEIKNPKSKDLLLSFVENAIFSLNIEKNQYFMNNNDDFIELIFNNNKNTNFIFTIGLNEKIEKHDEILITFERVNNVFLIHTINEDISKKDSSYFSEIISFFMDRTKFFTENECNNSKLNANTIRNENNIEYKKILSIILLHNIKMKKDYQIKLINEKIENEYNKKLVEINNLFK